MDLLLLYPCSAAAGKHINGTGIDIGFIILPCTYGECVALEGYYSKLITLSTIGRDDLLLQ